MGKIKLANYYTWVSSLFIDAQIEARVIMAKLMKYFSFELVPGQAFHFVEMVTCKPKDGCSVYVKPVVD